VLLEKFKGMMREKLGLGLDLMPVGQTTSQSSAAASQQLSTASSADDLSTMPLEFDTNLTDSQLTNIFQDMDFEFSEVTGLSDPLLGTGFGGFGM
jgi:hypothetical protein